jgi:hypothetical protein
VPWAVPAAEDKLRNRLAVQNGTQQPLNAKKIVLDLAQRGQPVT